MPLQAKQSGLKLAKLGLKTCHIRLKTRQIRLKNAPNKLNMRNQKRDRKTCNAGLEKYTANPYSLLPQLLRAGQQNIINSFQLAVRGALTKVFRREHTASHYAVQGGRKTAKSDITSIMQRKQPSANQGADEENSR